MTPAEPPEGGGRDAWNVMLLECFIGRAPTDLMSAYLVHFALSSSPFLLARYLQAALSYEFEGPGVCVSVCVCACVRVHITCA